MITNPHIHLMGPPPSTLTDSAWVSHIVGMRTQYMMWWKAKQEAKKAKAKAARPPSKPYSYRRNDKGTPIVTIRNRKPKYITSNEFLDLHTMCDLTQVELWNLLVKKKIEVRNT